MPGQPSPLWQSRCRNRRIAVNPNHTDFPALLAELLDTLAAADYDVKVAADELHCSATQLVNLLRQDPRALTQLNQHRAHRDLPALR